MTGEPTGTLAVYVIGSDELKEKFKDEMLNDHAFRKSLSQVMSVKIQLDQVRA